MKKREGERVADFWKMRQNERIKGCKRVLGSPDELVLDPRKGQTQNNFRAKKLVSQLVLINQTLTIFLIKKLKTTSFNLKLVKPIQILLLIKKLISTLVKPTLLL